jgi:hypothetical protein
MTELLDAVRKGRAQEVPGLLKPLTPVERKLCLAELKALRTEVRGWGWDRWQERFKVQRALLPAGAGCHTGAAAVAAWIGARDLRDGDRPLHQVLIDLLADRDPDWLAEVAHRLAGRPSTVEEDYPLIQELVRLARCPVPTTDGYVYGWAAAACTGRGRRLSRLHEDPEARVLAPRLFETPVMASTLTWYADPDAPDHWPSALSNLAVEGVLDRSVLVDACVRRILRGGRPGEMRFFLIVLRRLGLTPAEESARISDWIGMASDGTSTVAAHAQSVLARLAESGELPARTLAEVSAAVLFRTEKKLVRAQLVLLGKVLRHGDAEVAGELLPVVAEAFGHEDVEVQERALKLVGRYLPAEDAAKGPVGALREQLAESAALLSPSLRAAASELFPTLRDEGSPDAYEEFLPPAPEPRRLAPAADSVAELVEEVVVLTRAGEAAGSAQVTDFERTLDGLVRLAHREPTALAEALRGALATRWWLSDSLYDPDRRFSAHPHGVEVVAAALLERVSVTTLHNARVRGTSSGTCAHAGLLAVFDARLWEVAFYVRTRPLPFLLATPTWHTGALDPAELVERLREYQRLGVAPAPVDFAQALLRVPRGGTDCVWGSAAAAAAELGTAEGDRLAVWLAGEGPDLPGLRVVAATAGSARSDKTEAETGAETEAGTEAETEPAPERPEPAPGRWLGSDGTTRRLLTEARQQLAIRREFPKPLHWLGQSPSSSRRGCHHWTVGQQHWPAVVPHDRETVAAWLMPGARGCAYSDLRGGTWYLPLLAEAATPADTTGTASTAGPVGTASTAESAGPMLHRGLALGLGAQHADDRLAAVDALLVLAARGQLDGGRLGRELAALVRLGKVKPNRLAESARTTAATGAYATTWSVLVDALPGLLAAKTPPRGLGEILAVAADCVERCGTAATAPTTPTEARTTEIPGLAALAGRGGSSRLVAAASRLVIALQQGGEHSTPNTVENIQ